MELKKAMITHDTFVQTSKNGATTRAEKLAIGDVVYDGFTNRYCEISNLLSRTVNVRERDCLAPVTIFQGTCGTEIPRANVRVSPQQEVLYVARDMKCGGPARLESSSAAQLGQIPNCIGMNADEITYVALFFEQQCYLVCSGLLLPSYTCEILVSKTNNVVVAARQ